MVSSFFLIFSSSILSDRRLDVYHTSIHDVASARYRFLMITALYKSTYLLTYISANLECMSEMCCTRLAENTGRKKTAEKSPSVYHRTTLSGYVFCRQSEKNWLSSVISSTCSHNMVNFGPLTAKIGWRVCDTPANFNGFRVLASFLQ